MPHHRPGRQGPQVFHAFFGGIDMNKTASAAVFLFASLLPPSIPAVVTNGLGKLPATETGAFFCTATDQTTGNGERVIANLNFRVVGLIDFSRFGSSIY
jgi:hypothetical protein